MKRRALLQAAFSSAAWATLGCNHSSGKPPVGARRYVSLSPAITETLFAIGAGKNVVGVSDYCAYPEAARHLPRAGTSLTPNYEAIVRLAPSLIFCDASASAPRRELNALTVAKFLPWLSLEDIVSSTRLLGALTAHAGEAELLATKLWDGLAIAEAQSGPRVLAVLGEGPGKLSEIYFIKRNSIHGAALRAAGARNAVEQDVAGVPRLSIEELLRLDPEAILVLIAATPNSASEAQVLHDFDGLEPLTARQNGRIAVLKSDAAFANGPRILDLATQLRQAVVQLFPAAKQAK